MKPTLLSTILLTAIFIARPIDVHAQMSGAVTIDATAAASSANFKNWFSFWRSLQGLSRNDGGATLTAGISASVTVDVKSDLTEDSIVKFPAISGMSSTKTITIKGNGKQLIFGGDFEVISFRGADYFTVQNLVVRHKGSNPAAVSLIRFSNNSDYNTIETCTLEFSGLTSGSSTNGSAYIVFAAGQYNFDSITSTLTGSYNVVRNNLCRTTTSNSSGPSFGICVLGSSSGYSSTAHNNTFIGNTIQNFYYCAIKNNYTNGNIFLNNDISRANATSNNCATTLYGVICSNSYSSSRSTNFKGNTFRDLPYSSCPASGGVSDFMGIHATKNNGSASYPFTVDSNTFKNIAVYYNPGIGFLHENNKVTISRNVIDNLESYDNVSTLNIWDLRASDDVVFTQNKFSNSSIASWETYYVKGDSLWSPNYGLSEFSFNTVEKNSFFSTVVLFYLDRGEFKVHGNTVKENSIDGNNGGYIYGFMTFSFQDLELTNNLFAHNLGHDGVMAIFLYSQENGNYSCKVLQNTVYSDGSKAPATKQYETSGALIIPLYHKAFTFEGNIFYLTEADYSMVAGLDIDDTSKIVAWNNNTYYTKNILFEDWFATTNNGNSFAAWKTFDTYEDGDNNVDPKFKDISAGDFHSLSWQTQNDVKTDNVANPKDYAGANRRVPRSDRGIYEQYSDLKAVKTGFKVDSTVCSGSYLTNMDITVKNLFSDAANDFKVSCSVNGVVKASQTVSTKILTNDSLKITFSQPVQLNNIGNARIAIYIDASDDNQSNDSFIFKTAVHPAPGGSKFTPSTKPTMTIYKGGNPWDIIFPGQPWIYEFTPPRAYVNTQYNSHWVASVTASTLSGTPVSGATLQFPAGGYNAEVSFKTNNLNLQDSVIKYCVKITDLTNGCDTFYCFALYVNSVVIPDFSYQPLICGNDTAHFTNLSYVEKGGMYFHWDFGTGNKADTSNEIDAWFLYTNPGTYKVKLTAYTIPYGFPTYDSATITVKPKPTASFTRLNACENETVKFTNTSTPTTATYLWKFGDGGTSTAKDPTRNYASVGQYTVTLYANLNGCIDSASLKAFKFPNPKPNFAVPSITCGSDQVTFTNSTTIASGTFASYWSFGDGNTSNVANPKHRYGNGGVFSVKLIAVSDFGCKDSVTKSVTLKASPQVSFTNTELCSKDAAQFTNTTPPESGTIASFSWNFGDGGKSTAENPTHSWATVGSRTIKLVVSLDNGCKDSLSKNLTVRYQPSPDFNSNTPVCYGNQVIFENKTTWPQGSITYEWNFGDGKDTTISDPSHLYASKVTTTYNVTLCAAIDSFCQTCTSKSVTVNENPKTCDFVAEPDYAFGYYGIKCTPRDAITGDTAPQTGVTYTWKFHNSGNIVSKWGQYNFLFDGTYNVSMCAEFASTNCSCCVSKQVTMNRVGVNYLGCLQPLVYPNPNTGDFRIDLGQLPASDTRVQVFSTAGKLVHEMTLKGAQTDLHLGSLAQGLYLVKISGNGISYTSRIEIMR